MMDAANDIDTLLDEMIRDPRHGWSIGTFGAIGEFARDEDEPAALTREEDAWTIVTARGGLRVQPRRDVRVVAYDSLSSDGETWGQSIAFCIAAPSHMRHDMVLAMGPDHDALRAEDRDAQLFDVGTGLGYVHFCVRTRDDALIAALCAMQGRPLFGPDGAAVMAEILRAQPNRVLISPLGRVEVYSPIPAPDGKSPEGPHTHLMPRLLATRRTHAANAPIPEGLQPVLMLHPRSPWRDGLGRRVSFDAGLDSLFERLLTRFGLPEDLATRASLEDAIDAGMAPEAFPWPTTRRGRIEARITLRRLARTEPARIAPWRRRYDQGGEAEPDDEAALHG